MNYGSEVLNILEAGLAGDEKKAKAYGQLLQEKLQRDGDKTSADRVGRILEGKQLIIRAMKE